MSSTSGAAWKTLPEEIPRLRLDGPSPPRPLSQVVQGLHRPDLRRRFYGIVVRDFSPGRTTAPEAVEVLGQNLNPATIEMKSSRHLQPDPAGGEAGSRASTSGSAPSSSTSSAELEVRINDRPLTARPRSSSNANRCSKTSACAVIGSRLYWYRISAPVDDMTEPPVLDPETPDWVRDAIFYQIFPDRFARS